MCIILSGLSGLSLSVSLGLLHSDRPLDTQGHAVTSELLKAKKLALQNGDLLPSCDIVGISDVRSGLSSLDDSRDVEADEVVDSPDILVLLESVQ